ncbi:MAG: tyrosine-protein phosphatase [Acidimicrobiaceae bacterium]|nr:tyrosine-protein phosphatase [Acidimicrobiaceae bacterium]MYG55063.1 tyrosine-protein phosphatase [Acidimicrobiaceae bacterium]MYJ98239.1 tyrosine-protein phosphatase [Acidimicrobiaceae bacterium]
MTVTHINVVTDDDELIITWRGGSPSLSVFVSADPDDPGTDVRAPDAPGRTVIARTARRQYIHLFEPEQGFIVAAERCLDMDGADNFRDLGGYPTAQGSHSRWGRLFRSDRLDELTADDQARIESLNISTVFDLRSDGEVAMAPDRLPSTVRHVHLPMSSDVAQQRSMLARIIDGTLVKFDNDDMSSGYLRMLEGFGDYFIEVINEIIAGNRVLFHCTAGKDRTGVMAMVLLGLAGVPDAHLLDDYELSQQYRRPGTDSPFREKIRSAGFDPDDFETMWQSPRAVMRLTLEGFQQRWGDHASYLNWIGVSDETIAAARAELCTTAA